MFFGYSKKQLKKDVEKVLEENPKEVKEYKKRRERFIGTTMGQCLKANPCLNPNMLRYIIECRWDNDFKSCLTWKQKWVLFKIKRRGFRI